MKKLINNKYEYSQVYKYYRINKMIQKMTNAERLEFLFSSITMQHTEFALALITPQIVKMKHRKEYVLQHAAHYKNLLVTQALIDAGAKVNQRDEHRRCSPIFYAIEHQNTKMVNLLIDNGADVNMVDGVEQTPLHLAAQLPALYMDTIPNILQGLVTNKNVNKPDWQGNTPLHYAVRHVNVKYAKTLLENGALINAKNHANETPTHHLIIDLIPCFEFRPNCRQWEMFVLMMQYGADFTIQDDKGRDIYKLLTENELETLYQSCRNECCRLEKEILMKNITKNNKKNNFKINTIKRM